MTYHQQKTREYQVANILSAFSVIYGGQKFTEPLQINAIVDLARLGTFRHMRTNIDRRGRKNVYLYSIRQTKEQS